MRAAITPCTVLLVGSAPSYPHGVVDPIAEIAQMAQEHGLLCHVDACVGGFELPFLRRLGYPVPDFDFQVPGVTSMSADLHKYGYAAKGASVVLYRDSILRRHQFFAYTDWPGGVYASATLAGTRPGGPIAAAWAVLHYLGEEGYLALAERVMNTALKLRVGIAALPGLKILGDPLMSIMAIGSDRLNVYLYPQDDRRPGDLPGLAGAGLVRLPHAARRRATVQPIAGRGDGDPHVDRAGGGVPVGERHRRRLVLPADPRAARPHPAAVGPPPRAANASIDWQFKLVIWLGSLSSVHSLLPSATQEMLTFFS